MGELDFDELDRAVNNLMQKDGAPESGDAVAVQTSPAADPAPEVFTPVGNSTAPAVKRRGRFMDVVHPSSDMKTGNSVLPANREGVVIQPPTVPETESNEQVVQEEAIPHESESSDAPVAVDEAMSLSEDVHDEVVNAYPDPIDFAHTQDSSTQDASSVEPVEATVAESAPVDEAPLTSPFLPDAKVEKRPLGGAPEVEPLQSSEETEGSAEPVTDEAAPAEPMTSEPIVDDKPLPEELGTDVVTVEADQAEVAPVDQPDNEEVPAGGSIPQQYDEQPSSSDKTSAPIYDTADYHQPLSHPAEKKSGLMIIVWVLLLALIGAAGAVA